MKKQVVCILSVLVSLLIVTMSLPVGALTSDYNTNGTIALNEVITVEGTGKYAFYPETTGRYLFENVNTSSGVDNMITVYDENMEVIASDDDGGDNAQFKLAVDLTAGSLYYVKVATYYWDIFYFRVTLPENATGINVKDRNDNTIESVFAHVGEKERYSVSYEPEGSLGEDVEWSVENTDIASVDKYGNVKFLAAGETFLIVRSGNITKTLWVQVVESDEVFLDTPKTFEIPELGDHFCISFTAPETGSYRFYFDNATDINYSAYNAYGQYLSNISNKLYYNEPFDLAADEKIIIKAYYTSDNATSFTVRAEKTVYTESADIYINKYDDNHIIRDNYTVYLYENYYFGYEQYPLNSYSPNYFSFSSDNTDVATISTDGYLETRATGTANITVTDDNGISDTVAVNVVNRDTISIGTEYTVTANQEYGNLYIAEYVLPKDNNTANDNYKITYSSDSKVNITIETIYGDWITETIGTGSTVKTPLNENLNYLIKVKFVNPSEGDTCNFKIERFDIIESGTIVDENGDEYHYESTMRVGDSFKPLFKLTPEDADTDGVYFYTANTDVLRVEADGTISVIGTGNAYLYLRSDCGNMDEIRITAFDVEDITLGNSYTVTLDDYYKTKRLSFVPEKDGYYRFIVSGENYSPNVFLGNTDIYNYTSNYISETEQEYIYYLEKGNEYMILLNGNQGNVSTLCLTAYNTPNEVYITTANNNIINEFKAYSRESESFNFKYDDETAFVDRAVWESSNPEVVDIEDYGYARFLKAGSATITVTTDSKLTKTIEITVVDGDPIALDAPITENLTEDNNRVRYSFTPETSGYYKFSVDKYLSDLEILNASTFDYIEGVSRDYKDVVAYLTAGETYYFKARCYSDYGEYTFTLKSLELTLNNPVSYIKPASGGQSEEYYFIPEETNTYLFTATSDIVDDMGRSIAVYDLNGNVVSFNKYETGIWCAYATLDAGEHYRVYVYQYTNQDTTITLKAEKTVGFTSLELVNSPNITEFFADQIKNENFNLEGLSLNYTMADETAGTWEYTGDYNINGIPFIINTKKLAAAVAAGNKTGYLVIETLGASVEIEYTLKTADKLYLDTPVQISGEMDEQKILQYEFTPEKDGWYLLETAEHINSYNNMRLEGEDEYIGFAYTKNGKTSLYANLKAGKTYTLTAEIGFYSESTITLIATETVAITEIVIKSNPNKTTTYASSEPDLTGLVLTVTTSDGLVRDWTYEHWVTYDEQYVFEYPYSKSTNESEDKMYCYFEVCGQSLNFEFDIVEYPLESIEAITAEKLILVKGQNYDEYNNIYSVYNLANKIAVKLNYKDGTSRFALMNDYVDGANIYWYDDQEENPWTECGTYYITVVYREFSVDVPVELVEPETGEGPDTEEPGTEQPELEKMEPVGTPSFTVTEGMGWYNTYGENGPFWEYFIESTEDVKFNVTFSNGETYTLGIGDGIYGYVIGLNADNQYESSWEIDTENYCTVSCVNDVYGEIVDSIEVPVTVVENNIDKIEVVKGPDTRFVYGDYDYGYYDSELEEYYLFLTMNAMYHGVEFKVTYDDGTTEIITEKDLDEYGCYKGGYIVCYNSNSCTVAGTNQYYIAWGGQLAYFDVEVLPSELASIEIIEKPVAPEGLKYYPDMIGLKVRINYADGTSEIVEFTEENIHYENSNIPRYYVDYKDKVISVYSDYSGNYTVSYEYLEKGFNIEGVTDLNTKINDVNILEINPEENNALLVIYTEEDGFWKENYKSVDLSNAVKSVDENGDVKYNGKIDMESGILVYEISESVAFNGVTHYSISIGYYGADYSIIPNYGDLNDDGEIDIRDLVRMKKLLAGNGDKATALIDFDCDGEKGALDLALLRKSIFGDIVLTGVEYDANGDGYFDYSDVLAYATKLAGNTNILSSVADINGDGLIDKADMEAILETYKMQFGEY